jgi:hypothetical protein
MDCFRAINMQYLGDVDAVSWRCWMERVLVPYNAIALTLVGRIIQCSHHILQNEMETDFPINISLAQRICSTQQRSPAPFGDVSAVVSEGKIGIYLLPSPAYY